MSETLDLDALEKLYAEFEPVYDKVSLFGTKYVVCFGDVQPEFESWHDAEKLRELLKSFPRLIELARIGQAAEANRIDVVLGMVKPAPIIIDLDED